MMMKNRGRAGSGSGKGSGEIRESQTEGRKKRGGFKVGTVDRKVRDRGPGEGDPSTKEKKVNSVANKQKDSIFY